MAMIPDLDKLSSFGEFINPPPFVKKIIRDLEGEGFSSYVVGGAIRDLCLGRPALDWDIATSASSEDVRFIFRDTRSFCLKRGTVTLVKGNKHYEITTFKGSRGRGRDILEDLQHRDFTLNAMAYDVGREKILDPHGGKEDLCRKLIRAVGEPCERFREDPLRLLRAIRISSEIGFSIEVSTLDALLNMADTLSSVAKERIRDELMKILLSPKPSRGLNLIKKCGLMKVVLPELMEGNLKRQNPFHRYTIYRHTMEAVDNVRPDPVLRLTALLHDIGKPRVRKKINGEFRFYGHAKASAAMSREIMRRLRFSKEITEKVVHLISNHMVGYDSQWTDSAVRKFLRRIRPENIDAFFSFRKADLLAHGVVDKKADLLSDLEKRVKTMVSGELAVDKSDLVINGKIVMDVLDLRPGPKVGMILNELMENIIERPEMNTKESLIQLLKEMK